MVADGRCTLNGTILTDKSQKIVKLSDGSLLALAGEDSYFAQLIDYLEDETEELPEPIGEDEFTALLVETNGTIMLYEGKGGSFQPVGVDLIAIGSGSEFAYGALDAGATLTEAVQIAMGRDPNSGGAIHSEKLGNEEEAYSGPY